MMQTWINENNVYMKDFKKKMEEGRRQRHGFRTNPRWSQVRERPLQFCAQLWCEF